MPPWVYHTALDRNKTPSILWDGAHSILKFANLEPQLKNHGLPDAEKHVFVLQNSLPLLGWTVYIYDIAPEVDIAFGQLYGFWAYPEAWEKH